MIEQLRMKQALRSIALLVPASLALAAPGGVPAEIDSLKASVAAIQAQAATSQGQVAALQTALSGLSTSNTALSNRVATLQSSVSVLQTTNGSLLSQVASLQSANAAIGVTRVSRGTVLFNGSIVSGSGYVVLPDVSTGKYTIAYTTPRFTETPSCAVSAYHYQQPADRNNWYCMLLDVDVAGLTVQCYAPPGFTYNANGFPIDVTNKPSSQNFQFVCAQ